MNPIASGFPPSDVATWLIAKGYEPFVSLGHAGSVAMLMVSIAAFLMLGYPFMPLGGVMTYVERKIAAFTQSRIGPNRIGPMGLLVILADGIKLILKEDIIPAAVDRPLFKMAPYAVVGGAFMVMVVIPLGPNLIPVDLELGLLVYLAAGSFVTMGIVMSGWASNNKWSTMGGARSVAQIISYEIPVGLALLPMVLLTGSASFQAMVHSQGAAPWRWAMFHNPGLFLCAFTYFIAAIAEINRTPFDIPEAESELVSGYNTEYSGMRFGMFFVAEFANVVVISWITVLVFMGGWQFPGQIQFLRHAFGDGAANNVLAAQPAISLVQALEAGKLGWFALYQFIGHSTLMLKTVPLVVLIVLFRWTLPRVRVDQLMNICWKYLVPFGIFGTVVTGVWMAFGGLALPRHQHWTNPVFWGAVAISLVFVIRALLESRYEWYPARPGSGTRTRVKPSAAGLEAANARS